MSFLEKFGLKNDNANYRKMQRMVYERIEITKHVILLDTDIKDFYYNQIKENIRLGKEQEAKSVCGYVSYYEGCIESLERMLNRLERVSATTDNILRYGRHDISENKKEVSNYPAPPWFWEPPFDEKAEKVYMRAVAEVKTEQETLKNNRTAIEKDLEELATAEGA